MATSCGFNTVVNIKQHAKSYRYPKPVTNAPEKSSTMYTHSHIWSLNHDEKMKEYLTDKL